MSTSITAVSPSSAAYRQPKVAGARRRSKKKVAKRKKVVKSGVTAASSSSSFPPDASVLSTVLNILPATPSEPTCPALRRPPFRHQSKKEPKRRFPAQNPFKTGKHNRSDRTSGQRNTSF